MTSSPSTALLYRAPHFLYLLVVCVYPKVSGTLACPQHIPCFVGFLLVPLLGLIALAFPCSTQVVLAYTPTFICPPLSSSTLVDSVGYTLVGPAHSSDIEGL